MEKISTEATIEEQPRSGTANLALTGKDTEKCILQRHIRIGIGEDDIRALPSQFQRDLFEIRRCRDLDFTTRHPSTSESDFVHEGACCELRAHGIARSVNKLHGTWRKSHIIDQLE